jgi:uncharacterized membrane protein YtjA (UPF0391 family)
MGCRIFNLAIIASLLGFAGISGTSVNISWILFVVGLILAIVFALLGRRGQLYNGEMVSI